MPHLGLALAAFSAGSGYSSPFFFFLCVLIVCFTLFMFIFFLLPTSPSSSFGGSLCSCRQISLFPAASFQLVTTFFCSFSFFFGPSPARRCVPVTPASAPSFPRPHDSYFLFPCLLPPGFPLGWLMIFYLFPLPLTFRPLNNASWLFSPPVAPQRL